MPPESSRYSPEFTKKFRDAQWARAERLTERARGYIRERNLYRSLLKQPGFEKLPLEQRLEIERRAEHLPIMVLYRSEADLDYTDQITRPDRSRVRVQSLRSSRCVQPRAGSAHAHDPSRRLPEHDVRSGLARTAAREHQEGDGADARAGRHGRSRHLRVGTGEDLTSPPARRTNRSSRSREPITRGARRGRRRVTASSASGCWMRSLRGSASASHLVGRTDAVCVNSQLPTPNSQGESFDRRSRFGSWELGVGSCRACAVASRRARTAQCGG